MAGQNAKLNADKPVFYHSTPREGIKACRLFEHNISEVAFPEAYTFSAEDSPVLQDGKASLQRRRVCRARQSKLAGNSHSITTENVRQLQTQGESPVVDIMANKNFTILETSPTKTDVQAIIAVPVCSPVAFSATSEPFTGISEECADQPKQCLPGIDTIASGKQDSPKLQTSGQGEKTGGKSVTTVCDAFEVSSNDKSAAGFLGAQGPAGVNQYGESHHHYSNCRKKRKRPLPNDVVVFCVPNFSERSEGSNYSHFKEQRQGRTSVTSESITACRPLTGASFFNIQRQITDKDSEKKNPGGHSVNIAQKHWSQKSSKWLSTSTIKNALCLANLKEKMRERETLLTAKDSGKGKHNYEGLPSSLGFPPSSMSSPRRKSNQVPLMSSNFWRCTTTCSLQRPSKTGSKKAPSEVFDDMWTSHSQSKQVRNIECSLLSSVTKDITKSANPRNISDQDVQAAEGCCDNKQCVDQNLCTGSLTSSELSQPSVVPAKRSSLWAKSPESAVLGSKTHFQDSARPGKSSSAVPAKTILCRPLLEHGKPPVQRGKFWSRSKDISSQASKINKEVPKESAIPINAASPYRQSHSSSQGACGKGMKPSKTAGSFAIKDDSQPKAKDAGAQTSFLCMIGSNVQADREVRHRLLSSCYVGEQEVSFMDLSLRPAGDSAPLSFGTYITSASAALGIIKLRTDCEKPEAVDYAHDMFFYALDPGVLITTFGGTWTLLEKGSAFRLMKGMPYKLKNVGTATSKLIYVLTDPA